MLSLPTTVFLAACAAGADAALPPIEAIPFTAVRITDAFWAPRIEANRAKTYSHLQQ
jgi:hypothetical protein